MTDTLLMNADSFILYCWSLGRRPPHDTLMDVAFRNLTWTLRRCA